MNSEESFPANFSDVELLTTGEMGAVYRAWDSNLNRAVALKTLLSHNPGTETMRRFRLEMHVLSRLAHPLVIPILSSGVTKLGIPYFCMPRKANCLSRKFRPLRHRLVRAH